LNIKSKFLKVGWVLLFVLISIASVKADEWAVDGTIDQDVSYDDNVRMSEDPTASAIYKLTPTIFFSHRTGVSEISANASYGIERFSDIPEFDRDLQKYGISGLYRTLRSAWKIDSSYSVIPNRDNAEQDAGDFGSNAEATTRSLSPSVSYQLTQQDNLNITTGYSDTTFESGDGNSGNFSDRETIDISIAWSRQWTQRYTGAISLFYSNFESSNEGTVASVISTIDTAGINVSSTYLISEKWKYIGQIGIRVTESETETKTIFGNFSETFSSEGFLADIGLFYTGENISADMRFNRALLPSSQGRLNEQSRFGVNLNYKLSPRLSTNMLVSYQLSESASTDSTTERTNFTVRPNISWKMTPDWVVSASYRYRKQDVTGDTTSRTSASNLFMLSLKYNWQGLSLAR
jgi:hypothetical protein